MPCERQTPVDAGLLPASVAAVASVIGWPAALVLVESWPGQSLDISMRPTETMAAIRAAVGDPAADKLAAAYANSTLYIPACAHLARAERNRRIRDDVRELERCLTTRRAVTHVARRWLLTKHTI